MVGRKRIQRYHRTELVGETTVYRGVLDLEVDSNLSTLVEKQ